MDSEKKALDLFAEGVQRQMEGQIDLAIDRYRESINARPTAEAYTHLAWAHSFKGEFQRAISLCERAIEIDPDYGNPYNDIGAYLVEMGKESDAAPWFRRAIEAKRYAERQFPHYNLGRVFEKLGQWRDALAEYESALKEKTDYEEARRAATRLRANMN